MRPSHAGILRGVLIFSLFTLGCAPMVVRSYVRPGTDFTTLHTYTWAPAAALATGDPRLDNNPFFHERVRQDVDRELAARGFEKITTGTPELLLHYHASVSQRLDLNGVDRGNQICRGCVPFVYDAGTLLLDFVDARTNQLVWRAWAEGSLDRVVDNQDWMERQIDVSVARLMRTLPGRL